MRLDVLDEKNDLLVMSISQTNLENLQKYGQLVLYGGSPRYPKMILELRVQSDERHLSKRLDQMDDIDGG